MKVFDPRQGYDLYAPQYRKDHAHLDSFDWEAARAILMTELESRLSAQTGTLRFLDLGCGDGRTLKRLLRTREQRNWQDKLDLHGWDISDGMLRQARKALDHSVHLECRDLMDLAIRPPATSEIFHLVTSFFVLVHIDQPIDFCRAIKGVLAPGGRIIFNNIPQRDALVLEAGGQKFRIEYNHHEDEAVAAALVESGLTLVSSQATQWSTLFLAELPV